MSDAELDTSVPPGMAEDYDAKGIRKENGFIPGLDVASSY
jgi:hypothetical protein